MENPALWPVASASLSPHPIPETLRVGHTCCSQSSGGFWYASVWDFPKLSQELHPRHCLGLSLFIFYTSSCLWGSCFLQLSPGNTLSQLPYLCFAFLLSSGQLGCFQKPAYSSYSHNIPCVYRGSLHPIGQPLASGDERGQTFLHLFLRRKFWGTLSMAPHDVVANSNRDIFLATLFVLQSCWLSPFAVITSQDKLFACIAGWRNLA